MQRSLRTDALHLVALTSIALLQPLYLVLGSSVEFFVAHRASEWDVLAFVLVTSLAVPLFLVALEVVVGFVNERARAFLHLFLLGLLASVFVIVTLNRVIDWGLAVAGATSLLLGAVAGFMVWRQKALGDIVALLSIAVLLFPLQFLFLSPISGILFGESESAASKREMNSTPIVLVIFDEFNPVALLDENDEIDPVRFPNIAALAQTSYWYPNAASVHPQTIKSVPAILTGRTPKEGSVPPTFNAHPKSIFTLLGSQYRMNVMETVTKLCPDVYCPAEPGTSSGLDWNVFASDIRIILGHIVLPPAFASRHLPSLEDGWHDFGRDVADWEETRKAFFAQAADSRRRSRVADFRQFVANIEPGRSTLDAIHILLPHDRYQYLPDGTEYAGASTAGGAWPADQSTVDVAYQRYLLQLGMLDTLLGEMVQRLRQVEKFDEAMIVVTADHGRVFRVNTQKRELTPDTLDVLHTPLFIKFPNQERGTKDASFVSTADILPTVIDVIAADVEWQFSGASLLSETARTTLKVSYKGTSYDLTKDSLLRQEAIPDRLKKFGYRTGLNDLVLSTENDDLLGRPFAALKLEHGAEDRFQIDSDLSSMSDADRPDFIKPVLVSGLVRGASVGADSWVGIAMDGTVVAVVPVEHIEGRLQFSSVVPPSSVNVGANSVDFFLIEKVGMTRTLYGTQDWRGEGYAIADLSDGTRSIQMPAGDVVEIVPQAVRGYIYSQTPPGKGVHSFWGWAADLRAGQPAEYVLLFVNGKFVKFAEVNQPSPDVAEHYGNEDLALSGFRFEIPEVLWSLEPTAVTAFAVSKTGKATEMVGRGRLDANGVGR
ncbi:MAG: sulfatase-like hydrolase/transferase [Pseudomonadales bacterium]